MSGALASIQIDDSEFFLLLDQVVARAEDITPIMSTIGDIIKTSIVKNFEVGGRYRTDGYDWHGGTKKWAPLAASTVAQKKSNKNKILVEKGHLMNSIKYHVISNGVEVGTNRVYAAVHQFGFQAGRIRTQKEVNLPARPYMVIQDEDMEEIKAAISEYLTAGKK